MAPGDKTVAAIIAGPAKDRDAPGGVLSCGETRRGAGNGGDPGGDMP